MKMAVMTIALAATVGIFSLQQVSAGDVRYHGDNSRHFHKLDAAGKEKIEKFRAETKDLRKQVAMKRAEQTALIRSESPNIEAVRKTTGELFDLKVAVMEKARAAGLFNLRKRHNSDEKFAEKHAKLEKFFADTKDLRKQIAVEKAEKHALMHSRTPDPLAVAKVTGTLFELKDSLHEKAIAIGLPGIMYNKDKGRHHSHDNKHDFMG